MQVKFVTLDVFTDRQFGGNPLAVVADGTALSTRQMQAIAAEFNLAETTFVLPPERPEHTAKVRIFTPRAEMPFAGHPNVGTAFVLGRLGECHGRPIHGDILLFEEIAGLVRIELDPRWSEHVSPHRNRWSSSRKSGARSLPKLAGSRPRIAIADEVIE